MNVAIVSPRYGPEVGGGAEGLAREYAQRLAARHAVTVVTTCALDYRTWADHFAPGVSNDGKVRVLRFPVDSPRDPSSFDRCSARVLTSPAAQEEQERWMDEQGPTSSALLAHLSDASSYDVVIFIPYLYATTVRGLPLVANRAILVPALHDEPPARLAIFDDLFDRVRHFVFSTPEERAFAERRFGIADDRSTIVGAGVDPPPAVQAQRPHWLPRRYVVCLGRIDPSKGSDQLVLDHRAYRAAVPDGLDLVMVGRAAMNLPDEGWLVAPGFVSEDEKHRTLSDAVALVCPSRYESLSLVLLEAWSHGTPTISAADSPVLVGQSRRARAGLWYRNSAEYGECLSVLCDIPPLARTLGRSGQSFTRGLDWEHVIGRLEAAMIAVSTGHQPR